MNILELYLKLKIQTPKSKGFTLIELLVALAMASVVLVGLGTGLVALLSSSNTAAAKNDLKDQLNRAADYINEDLKNARIAQVETQDIDGDGNNDKVLVLTSFADIKASSPTIINYYLANASDPWRGPKILMRKEGSGTAQVLVDGLTENTISNTDFPCTTSTTTTRLDSGGGFQACIQKGKANSGADLYRTNIALFGEISDSAGTNPDSKLLAVDTDTISRSTSPSLDPPVISSISPTYSLTPSLVWKTIDGATSYRVQYCNTTDAINNCNPTTTMTSGSFAGSPPAGSAQYNVTSGPPEGSRACYSVVAIGYSVPGDTTSAQINSVASNVICTIISPSSVPSGVTSTNFTVSNEIQPVIDYPYDANAIEYKLYRCQTAVAASNGTITPCTPTVADTNLVASFFAASSVDFGANLPWAETKTPADNTAFCYGLIKGNNKGYSAISPSPGICGKVNAVLTTKSDWLMGFTKTFATETKPTGITWASTSGAPTGTISYQIRRCTTTGQECDPTTDVNALIIDNGTSATYTEDTQPAETYRYCYTVRGMTTTQASVYATTQCGDVTPKTCVLNLDGLGQGTTINRPDVQALSERNRLVKIVTDAGFASPTTSNTPTSLYSGSTLYEVRANGVNARSTYGTNSATLLCSTPIAFLWEFTVTNVVSAPVIDNNLGNSSTATVSWPQSLDPQGYAEQYELYWCTTPANTSSCTPTTSSIAKALNSTRTFTPSAAPQNNRRYCYSARAFDTDTNVYSAMSGVVCAKQQ